MVVPTRYAWRPTITPRFSGYPLRWVKKAWSPLQLPSLFAWYDASNAGSITESSGAVSQWNDLSGNGNHLTQGTGSNQPITGTRTQNSLNAIDFDGTAHYMTCSLASNITGANHTAIGVVLSDVTTANKGWISVFLSSGSADWDNADSWLPLQINSGTRFESYSGSNRRGYVDVTVTQANVLVAKANGSDCQPYANGTAGTSEPWVSNINSDRLRVGARYEGSTATNFWNGIVCEVIYCTAALSDTDRNAAEDYLQAKWGTP